MDDPETDDPETDDPISGTQKKKNQRRRIPRSRSDPDGPGGKPVSAGGASGPVDISTIRDVIRNPKVMNEAMKLAQDGREISKLAAEMNGNPDLMRDVPRIANQIAPSIDGKKLVSQFSGQKGRKDLLRERKEMKRQMYAARPISIEPTYAAVKVTMSRKFKKVDIPRDDPTIGGHKLLKCQGINLAKLYPKREDLDDMEGGPVMIMYDPDSKSSNKLLRKFNPDVCGLEAILYKEGSDFTEEELRKIMN